MVSERANWRAAVGVGWMLVVGACSGSDESSVSSLPGLPGQRESTTVLDQRTSDASPTEAPPPPETQPAVEAPLSAEMPPIEMPPSAQTLPPAETPPLPVSPPVEPVTSPPPAALVQPDAGIGSTTGQDGSEPSDAAPPASEAADAGLPLASDASVPVAVPEPPPIETPVEPTPPAVPETAADAGAPPEVVPEPPAPPVEEPPVEEPPPPPPPTSFETEVWPIFKARCASCHGTRRAGGHSVGSAVLGTAYSDAQRLGSTLIERLGSGGGMPPACSGQPGDPGCITVLELGTIQRWLDTGMAP
jgi:hypothetical protein